MPSIDYKTSTVFSGLNAVALSPSGNLAAVCFNDRELLFYRIAEGPPDMDRTDFRKGGYLEEYRFLRLPQGRYNRPPQADVHYQHTKLAFLDEESLLVARQIEQVGGGSWKPPEKPANISLAALNIPSGELVAELTDSTSGSLLAVPLLIPPKYILFPASYTAICLDATSFREVFRVPGASEQICENGVAYDPGSGTLYVLWWQFESSFLQTYRLYPGRGAIEELETRSFEPLARRGFEANSLCLRSDGKEVAVWFTTSSEVVRRGTRVECAPTGKTARLGQVGVFAQEGDRHFDVHSAFESHDWVTRDFKLESIYGYGRDKRAEEIEIAICYRVDAPYSAKPFYLGDHTVVINTPGGLLMGVDTVSGGCEELADAHSPIEDLCVHPEQRLLLVGTKGGGRGAMSLTLLDLG
jgi:hypothetical protein